MNAFSGMLVDLYPRADYDTAIEFTYSCIPIGEIGDVELNLPDEAREAIVAGSLAEVLLLPGEHQNLQLSEMKRVEYERLKSKLTAIGVLGYGGTATFTAPPFLRNNRAFTPVFRS